MKIIGIDPGNNYVALVVWDVSKRLVTSHFNKIYKTHIDDINDHDFHYYDKDGIKINPPVVIEIPQSYGGKGGSVFGQSMIDTCRMVGRCEQVLEQSHSVFLVSRPSIAGHFSAKGDAQIRAALRDRFCTCRAAGPCKKGCCLHGLNNDERSALAAAVAWHDNQNIRRVE